MFLYNLSLFYNSKLTTLPLAVYYLNSEIKVKVLKFLSRTIQRHKLYIIPHQRKMRHQNHSTDIHSKGYNIMNNKLYYRFHSYVRNNRHSFQTMDLSVVHFPCLEHLPPQAPTFDCYHYHLSIYKYYYYNY